MRLIHDRFGAYGSRLFHSVDAAVAVVPRVQPKASHGFAACAQLTCDQQRRQRKGVHLFCISSLHTEPGWPLDVRFAELGHTSALRAPGGGRPFLRAASGPRNQLLGTARPGRAAQQHCALGPIWAFLGHTSPRGVVIWRFSNWRLAQGTSWAERTNSRCPQRFSAPRSRRDGPTADLLHCAETLSLGPHGSSASTHPYRRPIPHLFGIFRLQELVGAFFATPLPRVEIGTGADGLDVRPAGPRPSR